MQDSKQEVLQELQEKYPQDLDSLVGVDGNAFALMGAFRKSARRNGWDAEDIDTVLEIAQSGDYDNLVATLATFTD